MDFVGFLIIASASAIGLAVVGLTSRSRVQQRLARLSDGSVAPLPEEGGTPLLTDEAGSLLGRLLARFGRRAADTESASYGPVRTRLMHAGYRRESAVSVYMGSRIVLALVLPVAFLMVAPGLRFEQLQVAALACMAGALGLVLPSFVLDRRIAQRRTQILNGLPDALDLMVICVEAGLGVNACLARVAKDFVFTNPVLSAEFELVTLEIRHGKSNSAALRSLAGRTGVAEVSSLVAMLVQTERFGTSLADTLRVHADEMRIQRLQRAEELAAKVALKMLFPTVLIFIASLVVTIGPGMLSLMSFFRDRA